MQGNKLKKFGRGPNIYKADFMGYEVTREPKWLP